MASSKRICPLRVDAVEKVTAKGLWNQKLKRTNPAGRFLNQDFAFALDLESMCLPDPAKILFRQHRSITSFANATGTSALPRLATEERTSQIGSEGPNADILTRQEMINVPGLPIVMGPRWNVCQFRRRAHCIQIFRSIFVVWVCLVISASYAQDVDGNQPARPWLRKASVDL